MTQKQKIEVDAKLCRDCQVCVLACSLHHEGECNLGLARLVVTKDMGKYEFDIVICKHCDEPDCILACPSDAMVLNEQDVVIILDDDCNRCGSCAANCPHDAIFYNEAQDRYIKCDLCADREDGPLCVELCPVTALTLVNTEDVAQVEV
jgi:carbon-monoxide dehydrogenase iron sulfur subunit